MDDETVRAIILDHYAASGVDEVHVAQVYADDAILDFPQGGERIRGKARILGFRTAFPAQVRIVPRRIVGSGDVWVIEGTISYDGVPQHLASIWELRDGKVVHETVYIADPWEPPAWRAQWVEPMPSDAEAGTAQA
jgi:ketosteroid isomerase-like protein